MSPQPVSKENSPTSYEQHSPWGYPPAFFIQGEEEINLLEYWRVLKKRKWQIVLTTFLLTTLVLVITFWLPKKYKAEVNLMPLTSNTGGGLSSMASQFSSLPGMGGLLGDLGKGMGKSKELINILKSKTLAVKIINEFDLMKVFYKKQWDPQTKTFRENFFGKVPLLEDVVGAFRKNVIKVEEDKKTGLIKIAVNLPDSQLAAQIANRMVVDLQDFIEKNSLTVAKRNRIFLEEQLVKTRGKLIEAGKELNQFYLENKISSVFPQLDVEIGSFQPVPQPLEDFRKEVESLENKQKEAEAKKEQAFVRKVPGQVYQEYLILNRELLGKTYGFLLQQYEMAKIDEAKEDLAFQVLDKADVKIRPDFPKKKLNVIIGFIGGLFLAIFIAFFQEYIQKMKAKEATV